MCQQVQLSERFLLAKRVAVAISGIKVFLVKKMFLLNCFSATPIKHDEKVLVLDRSAESMTVFNVSRLKSP